MTAGFFIGWILAGLAVAGAWILYRLGVCQAPPDTQDWQQSAAQAAQAPRTEAEVRADLDSARQAADDLADCLAIWDATPHDIPHQTRRTEEDQ